MRKDADESIRGIFLISLDLDGRTDLVLASGSLLLYLGDTQKQRMEQFKHLDIRESSNYMQLDRSTLRNLELLETLYDKNKEGSLLGVLDHTHTAMGGRLLKRFIKEPLNNQAQINARLEAVDAVVNHPLERNNLVAGLGKSTISNASVPAWPAAAPTERIWWR